MPARKICTSGGGYPPNATHRSTPGIVSTNVSVRLTSPCVLSTPPPVGQSRVPDCQRAYGTVLASSYYVSPVDVAVCRRRIQTVRRRLAVIDLRAVVVDQKHVTYSSCSTQNDASNRHPVKQYDACFHISVTVYIQLFSFRAASVLNKLSCQLLSVNVDLYSARRFRKTSNALVTQAGLQNLTDLRFGPSTFGRSFSKTSQTREWALKGYFLP